MRGTSITEADFQAEVNKISPFAKTQFAGPEGKRRMLDRMVQNEILYLAAREKGYQNSSELQQQLRDYERNLLIREYYKNEIQDRVETSDAAVADYYDRHKDKYVEKARVKVRHILAATEEDAATLRRELDNGADFRSLAREKSKDKLSARRDGLLGNIIENGYIPTVGKDEAIQKALFAMQEGEVSQPIKSRKGYHLFLVEQKTEGRQKELAEVEDVIKGELKRELLTQAMDDKLEALRRQFEVTFHEEAIEGAEDPGTDEFEFDLPEGENVTDEPPKSEAEETEASAISAVKDLLAAAARQSSPEQSLRAYERIIADYPTDPETYKAKFMIGFVCSEQLGDTTRALTYYERVIKEHPDCDLAESARYMVKELSFASRSTEYVLHREALA
jgi:peptidyl-prolyl cis-trans isomerase C